MTVTKPSRADLLDLGFLVALSAAALLGLAPTFTGWGYLVVGMVGVLLGAGFSTLAAQLRWPAAAPIAGSVAIFFLLGGPLCLRAQDAVVPGPKALDLLATQAIHGWKDLLTTLPPIDGSSVLLVLPWVLGLATGTLGLLLARVRRGPVWCVALLPLLAPVALLAAVILLGIRHPHSMWVQGVVFAGLSLAWLAVRAQAASAPVQGSAGRVTRLGTGVLIVGLAGALALPVGSWMSGGDDKRVILRSYVEPPFDVGQYPSPLSSFRRYVKMPEPDAVNLYDEELFRVDGAPAGSRMRFAALDHYDGVVWGAANNTVPGTESDMFQRVSRSIDNPASGPRARVRVTLAQGYSGVWLPTLGALQSLDFAGPDADAKAEAFRYNLATRTAVVPSGVRPGDSYSFETVLPDDTLNPDDAASTAVTDSSAAAFLDTQVQQWGAGATAPMRRVFAVADHLKREGKYSDGVIAAEKIYHPGHHVRRLSEEFVNAPIMVGNDEQYAALMALLANRIGVPARVVMGAVVPEGGVVKGSDVQAWVEIRLADGSWRTLPTETFMDTDRPAEQPPINEQEMTGTIVPPPAPIPPPSTAGEQTDAELHARKGKREGEDDEGFSLPGWVGALLLYVGLPLLVLLAIVAAIIGAKAVRRTRRRNAPRVSARFVGGWRELVDHARDLGHVVPAVGTRREQSALVPTPAAVALARSADAHVFGPVIPEPSAAETFWAEVEAARKAMSEGVSRGRRFLAAVDVRTFWRR